MMKSIFSIRNPKRLALFGIVLLCIALTGCKQKAVLGTGAQQESDKSGKAAVTRIDYSQLLSLTDVDGYTLCQIQNPWRNGQIEKQYLLVPANDLRWNEDLKAGIEAQYGPSIVLRTPLKRLVVTAACHAWLLSQLDALGNIAVMCDTNYVKAKELRAWLSDADQPNASRVADGGNSMSPNAEVIMMNQCDGIMVNPFENMGNGNLGQIPVPVIYCADYLETSPLGRAEWMKFYGRLVGKANEADRMFAAVARNYEQLMTAETTQKKLLAEIPYGATWYVAGGCSTSALLYQDAGYIYPWADDRHAGSLALSKEAVLAKAQDCDIWLIKYNDPERDWTLKAFVGQDEIYRQFRAAQNGDVWACNTATSDFFDVTPFRPDSMLQSLINLDGNFFERLK